MAKTTTAPQSAADLKAEQDRIKAQLDELKAAEKAAKEKAKALAEKESEEKKALREQVQAELEDAQAELNEAKEAVAVAKAKVAEVMARLPKGSRGSGSNGPRIPRDPSKLSLIQTRIIAFMVGRKTATRQELADAGTGKVGATLDAQGIGSLTNPILYPYSLLGRKMIQVEEVDGKRVLTLTSEGREAAKAAKKQLNSDA